MGSVREKPWKVPESQKLKDVILREKEKKCIDMTFIILCFYNCSSLLVLITVNLISCSMRMKQVCMHQQHNACVVRSASALDMTMQLQAFTGA